MKFLLIDNYDNIVTTVDLGSSIGLSGAKTYFKGVKQMPKDKDFDKLWKVLSETDYDRQRELANREGKQYEWWKDEPTGPDDGIDY